MQISSEHLICRVAKKKNKKGNKQTDGKLTSDISICIFSFRLCEDNSSATQEAGGTSSEGHGGRNDRLHITPVLYSQTSVAKAEGSKTLKL